MQIVLLLSFPGGIWAFTPPPPPPRPSPLGVGVGLFHHYWAPEAERTIYIFIFKPLLGINLSHLNHSLSFLSSHYFKHKPQEVAVEFPIISFNPLPVFKYHLFLRLRGMQTAVLEYEMFSFKPDAF